MARANRYSPEVQERAVRMVHEQESCAFIALGHDRLDCREDRLYA